MARPAGAAPSTASLREAALRHISRYATTEAGLVRVLDRRVQRWAREAALEGEEIASVVLQAREAARQVARAMVESGFINDASFASARSARLERAGRSHRAIAAHLADKGVSAEAARAALPEPEREIPAALAYARRRRLGPYRNRSDSETTGLEDRQRELGALARAGFPRDVAERALQMPLDLADALLLALKQGTS